MTFNWGHKVTIGFLAFATMIIYLVVQSMHTHYDLVSKDYYKEELQYQQVIDGASRANQLTSQASITQTKDQLVMQLPKEMQQKTVTGSLLFYSADNAQKDKTIALQVNDNGIQTIDSRAFIPGNYTVKIKWESNSEQYYTELPVTIH
jgi:hypothetical protein